MASPNERKLRKLALMKKIEELNGGSVSSAVVGAVIDTVEVVEDVVEDIAEVAEEVVEEIVEAVKPVRRGRAKKVKKTEE
jgi:hypothetical protein